MKKITIAVVIPTHNRPELLRRAIQSVLDQTVLPDEIIVVDDLNDSRIKKLCEIFSSKVIRYIPNLDGQGASSSRNLGVMNARSEYIAFLDDDDEFKAEKIERLREVISKNPEADLVYHSAHIHMVNEGVSYFTSPKEFKEVDDVLYQMLIKNEIGGTPMVIVKRESFISCGMFDENLPALEDYEMWVRMAKLGCSFLFVNSPLTNCYCFTGKGSVSKAIHSNIYSLVKIRDAYKEHYDALHGEVLAGSRLWEKKLIVHKALLSNNKILALRGQISVLRLEPSLANMMLMLLIPFGVRFVFRLRARLAK